MAYRSKPRPGARIMATGPAADGLLLFFPFNEASGLPWDLGAIRPAVSSNAVWSGDLVTFNGTSQWINLGSRADLTLSGPLTLAFCGNPAASVSANVIDSHNYPTNTAGFGFNAGIAGTTTSVTYYSTSSSVSSSASALDGTEHSFSVSHVSTASGGVRFYRDGIPWGTGTSSYPPAYSGQTVIGARSESGTPTSRWYAGFLRWVAIWGRALSADESLAYFATPRSIYEYLFPRRRDVVSAASAEVPAALLMSL